MLIVFGVTLLTAGRDFGYVVGTASVMRSTADGKNSIWRQKRLLLRLEEGARTHGRGIDHQTRKHYQCLAEEKRYEKENYFRALELKSVKCCVKLRYMDFFA